MVHSFEKLGGYFILDTESGSLYAVNEQAYLGAKVRYETPTDDERAKWLALSEAERAEITAEFEELEAEGVLALTVPNPVTHLEHYGIIKAMCLNICHDCNLRCKYCFADEGAYNGERGKMREKTACEALDFLVKASKTRTHLEVDFFGGEPMMNFGVVKAAVAHAKELEREYGKKFKFTITTNAVKLTDEDIAYINENMDNVVLSIDGRKQVHDAVRPNVAGQGSFDVALKNSLALRKARGDKEYYVRGTFTSNNLDFSTDALALADYGFDQVSLEPVVLPDGHPLALKREHLAQLKKEYVALAEAYKARWGTEQAFNFFHFNVDLTGGPCERKRLTGCGAGTEYVAVADNGDIYPCHQFVGDPAWKIGNIHDGITNPEIPALFCDVNINTKPACKECWARYYCSGGCNANAVHFNGDIKKPVELLCELSRERIECALALKALAQDGE